MPSTTIGASETATIITTTTIGTGTGAAGNGTRETVGRTIVADAGQIVKLATGVAATMTTRETGTGGEGEDGQARAPHRRRVAIASTEIGETGRRLPRESAERVLITRVETRGIGTRDLRSHISVFIIQQLQLQQQQHQHQQLHDASPSLLSHLAILRLARRARTGLLTEDGQADRTDVADINGLTVAKAARSAGRHTPFLKKYIYMYMDAPLRFEMAALTLT